VGQEKLIFSIKETYMEAASVCCDMGMTLVSIEAQGEHQCLVDLNKGWKYFNIFLINIYQ